MNRYVGNLILFAVCMDWNFPYVRRAFLIDCFKMKIYNFEKKHM